MPRVIAPVVAAAVIFAASAAIAQTAADRVAHGGHVPSTTRAASIKSAPDSLLPAGSADAAARLAASPRHREWVMIATGGDSVGAWVVYPERKTKAPVVLVVHEVFGLSTWVRAVADQLAAQGFIAIAPDLLTGKRVLQGGPDSMSVDSLMAMVHALKTEDVQRQLIAVANYGTHLPAAVPRYGIVGFCWGGGVAFAHAAFAPALGASVVYYGPMPDSTVVARVRAPVLGLYGGDDMRVDAMIPPADSLLRRLGRTYQYFLFAGAGHGFLRDQAGRNGANLAAAQAAWPKTIAWFRTYLEP
jgi:carboxymethylenebutenolidase